MNIIIVVVVVRLDGEYRKRKMKRDKRGKMNSRKNVKSNEVAIGFIVRRFTVTFFEII